MVAEVVNNTDNTTSCTLVWTSLNEAVCRLDEGNFTLQLKYENETIAFEQQFERTFYDAEIAYSVYYLYQMDTETSMFVNNKNQVKADELAVKYLEDLDDPRKDWFMTKPAF